jgi:hypothetical protein
MNIAIYVSCFIAFISFCIASLAIVRVAKFDKSLVGLDWEAVATLLGDVATVKRSITRLNGRLNGMDSPKYDVEQEIARAMTQPVQQKPRGG